MLHKVLSWFVLHFTGNRGAKGLRYSGQLKTYNYLKKMQWNVMEWNGMEFSGMEWKRKKCNGKEKKKKKKKKKKIKKK